MTNDLQSIKRLTLFVTEKDKRVIKMLATEFGFIPSDFVSLFLGNFDKIFLKAVGESGQILYDSNQDVWKIQNNPKYGQDLPYDKSPLRLILKTGLDFKD